MLAICSRHDHKSDMVSTKPFLTLLTFHILLKSFCFIVLSFFSTISEAVRPSQRAWVTKFCIPMVLGKVRLKMKVDHNYPTKWHCLFHILVLFSVSKLFQICDSPSDVKGRSTFSSQNIIIATHRLWSNWQSLYVLCLLFVAHVLTTVLQIVVHLTVA